MSTTEIIRNPDRKIDSKTLYIIKDIFEKEHNAKVLSMFYKGNDIFLVFVTNIKDTLSFLKPPKYTKEHISTTFENLYINCFELGALLYTIYLHGYLKYIDFILSPTNILEPSSEYIELCELLEENIPFNIYKANFLNKNINTLDKNKLEFLRDQMVTGYNYMINHHCETEIDDSIVEKYNNIYLDDIETENDCVRVCNDLNDFASFLKILIFNKISEKKINDIDEIYKKIRLKYK